MYILLMGRKFLQKFYQLQPTLLTQQLLKLSFFLEAGMLDEGL